jgi:hypothetical protein
MSRSRLSPDARGTTRTPRLPLNTHSHSHKHTSSALAILHDGTSLKKRGLRVHGAVEGSWHGSTWAQRPVCALPTSSMDSSAKWNKSSDSTSTKPRPVSVTWKHSSGSSAAHQGLTPVHVRAELEPFLTQNTP